MNLKRELTLGVILATIFLFVTIFYVSSYKPKLSEKPPVSPTASSLLTMSQLSTHNNPNDCWIQINGKAYDVTQFALKHPGSAEIMYPYCGKDATAAFTTKGGVGSHSQKALDFLNNLYIGDTAQ